MESDIEQDTVEIELEKGILGKIPDIKHNGTLVPMDGCIDNIIFLSDLAPYKENTSFPNHWSHDYQVFQ